jgi:hypothetical protein
MKSLFSICSLLLVLIVTTVSGQQITGQRLIIAPDASNSVTGVNSGVFGFSNIHSANSSVVLGAYNFTEGGYWSSSIIVGTSNAIYLSSTGSYSAKTALIGEANFSEGNSNSIMVGLNNFAGGNTNSGIVGRGLANLWNDCLVAGRYNDTSVSGIMFAVGNGVDASNRSNALEVYSDGKILMPRQGDILMGEFGN